MSDMQKQNTRKSYSSSDLFLIRLPVFEIRVLILAQWMYLLNPSIYSLTPSTRRIVLQATTFTLH
jgi:hypothetical protein